MRNILQGTLCGGGSGRGRGGEDPLANQEDPPPSNTSLEVRGGSSDQQDEPLASPTFLLVFPLRPSLGQPPPRPTFVVFPVFQQVEPSSIRLPIRPQVWFPSDSHGHTPLSPHRVAIEIPASADIQDVQEVAGQVEVEDEEARQVEEAVQLEEARRVEEAVDPPAPVEEQAQLPVPLRPVIQDFFRFPGIPGQQ
nr:hypothetical protein Iba_chr10eCG14410 [Ipomoea batatas]